jgi:hypothetical protein
MAPASSPAHSTSDEVFLPTPPKSDKKYKSYANAITLGGEAKISNPRKRTASGTRGGHKGAAKGNNEEQSNGEMEPLDEHAMRA